MKRIKVNVTAIDPLIITSSGGDTVLTPSADYISGTMLRGILASEYIKDKNLGTEAHRDAGFRKLFFDRLNFTNAMPCGSGQAAFPVPFSLVKHKVSGEIQDLLADGDVRPGFKTLRGMAVVREDKLCGVSVHKNIAFHMSRSSEDERLAGRSVDGQVFNYESIEPGQVFSGEVIGEKEALQELLDTIPQKNFSGRVGRSRFTQYGAVKVQLGDIEDVESDIYVNGNAVFIHAVSPIIPLSGCVFTAEETLNEMGISDVLGAKITKVFASVVTIDNFVNIWGMKRPRVQALGEGTVFALEKDQWTEENIRQLKDIISRGIGQRTQEGFGQLRVWRGDVKESGKQIDCFAAVNGVDKLKNGFARDIVTCVVEKYILEQLKQFAYKDAMSMKNIVKGKTHFFARLLQELGDMNLDGDNRQLLADKVKVNLDERKNSPYYKAMKNLSLKHSTLEDLLSDVSAPMPYIEEWHQALNRNKLGELMDKAEMRLSDKEISSGKYFYAYWQWLFRYCRKLAVKGKENR